jgi:branched-chain amino acid transport system substrate-binding protein
MVASWFMARPGRRRIEALLAAACLLSGACQRSQGSIRIGAVLPLTGGLAELGSKSRQGIEAAVVQINQGGGVHGKVLEVIYKDSQGDPQHAAGAISELATVYRVPAVLGDLTSPATLAMARIAESERVTLVSPTATAPIFASAGRLVFRISPSGGREASQLAEWALQKGYRKIAILHHQTSYSEELTWRFREAFEKGGGFVAIVETHPPDGAPHGTSLKRIESTSPEAVLLISLAPEAVRALQQARHAGLTLPFFGLSAADGPGWESAGEAAEGFIFPASFRPDPAAASSPGRFADPFSARSHDAVLVIAAALRDGAATGNEIQAVLHGRRSFPSTTEPVRFDATGENVGSRLKLLVVHDGRVQPLP